MPGKLPPTLKKIGFKVIHQQECSQSRSRWQRIDDFIRHPVILIFITSLFSVGVGTWLTSQYQTYQRERDAIAKSMDDVRASIDRAEQVYAEFMYAAASLEEAIVSSATEKQVDDAWVVFRGADRILHSQRTFESARLRQEMPLGSGGAFELMTGGVNIGIALITDCLAHGQPISAPGEKFYGKRLKCRSYPMFQRLQYVDERIDRVDACLKVIFRELRPDPADDFTPNRRVKKMNQGIHAAAADCNNVTMLGYVPPEELREEMEAP